MNPTIPKSSLRRTTSTRIKHNDVRILSHRVLDLLKNCGILYSYHSVSRYDANIEYVDVICDGLSKSSGDRCGITLKGPLDWIERYSPIVMDLLRQLERNQMIRAWQLESYETEDEILSTLDQYILFRFDEDGQSGRTAGILVTKEELEPESEERSEGAQTPSMPRLRSGSKEA